MKPVHEVEPVAVGTGSGIARVLTPAPRDVWRALLRDDPEAGPAQTPEWLDWLCAARGYVDASRLYEFRDGRRMVLPMAGKAVHRFRITQESMPYGYGYGGLVGDGSPASTADVRSVLDDLRRQPSIRTGVTPSPGAAGTWSEAAPPDVVLTPTSSQVIDLTGGFDAVWSQRYRKDTRKKVRRAEKAPLDVRRSTSPDFVAAFDHLHRQSIERWAAQRGQPRWVGHLVERRRDRTGQLRTAPVALPGMFVGWSAYLDGEPVAAYAMLRWGSQAVSWLSAMNRELADRTCAGYLLQSSAIEEACAGGARSYHLGESDPGSGVEQFKAAFGAVSYPSCTLRFERLPVTATYRGARALAGRVIR